jgi:ADP-ribose pyrophosphatase YjhB (NUDIX family)
MEYHEQFGYCPGCGTGYSGGSRRVSPAVSVCNACGLENYHNSKPSVSGIVPSRERPGRVLVMQRATMPCVGLLALPGGILDYGEDPVVGVRREVAEETGADVVPDRVLRCHLVSYQYKGAHIWMLESTYLCEAISEASIASHTEEASRVYFEEVEALVASPDRFAFPGQLQVIADCRALTHVGGAHALQV